MLKYFIALVLWNSTVNGYSFSDFDGNCRVLHTTGYGYNSFFHIPQSSIDKEDSSSVRMNISVVAPSNAHILLSPKNALSDRDPVYEIVLGAGKNTFSTIRKLRTSIRVSVNSPSILDEQDLKMFWIHLHKNTLDVGQAGDPKPLLQLEDPNQLQVNYIAFGAWVGVTATWIYDCKNVTTTEPNKTLEEQLNGRRRLEYYLLENNVPYAMPKFAGQKMFINTTVNVQYVDLNMDELRLKTVADMNFIWSDQQLKWKPSNFDNITTLRSYNGTIWKPEFFIFNSAKQMSAFDGRLSRISVRNNGQVNLLTRTQFVTICDRLDVTKWPWDSHACQIRIGLHPYRLPVKFLLQNNGEISPPKIVGNDWKLRGLVIAVENLSEEEKLATNNSSNVLVIDFSLKRHSSSAIYIFLLPLVCSVVISQFSFLLPPDCSARLHLHFVSLIIFTVYLLVIFHRLPVHYLTTSIVVNLCSQLLMLVAFHTIITAFIVNCAKFNEDYPPWLFVRRFLGNKSIRNLFLLPEDGCYNELEENTRQKYGNIWFIFAIFLDRIVFSVSILIVATSILAVSTA